VLLRMGMVLKGHIVRWGQVLLPKLWILGFLDFHFNGYSRKWKCRYMYLFVSLETFLNVVSVHRNLDDLQRRCVVARGCVTSSLSSSYHCLNSKQCRYVYVEIQREMWNESFDFVRFSDELLHIHHNEIAVIMQ